MKVLRELLRWGIGEVQFAGGLWEVGTRSGVSLAVFRADGLTAAILFEFYETGARTAPKTDRTETSDVTVAGVFDRAFGCVLRPEIAALHLRLQLPGRRQRPGPQTAPAAGSDPTTCPTDT